MRKFIALLLLCAGTVSAQVPKVGSSFHTEIACWNLEWFGYTQFGPTDEALQYSNVKSVLQAADIDIWGLEEVSNPATFSTLVSELPQYGYVLASYSQTQKTALIWKKNLFRRVSSGLILNQYSNVFASGRLPLLVTLVSDSLPRLDTLNIIVLHMKANTGTDAEKLQAYYDRRDAGIALKNYIDQNLVNKKLAIIGDWNDRPVKSIYKDSITPYKNFVDDGANYFFATLQADQNGGHSTVGFTSSVIDNIVITNKLKAQHETGSTKIFYLDSYITNYGTTTSDHYPVYSFYNFNIPAAVEPVPALSPALHIYPNPSNNLLQLELEGEAGITHLRVLRPNGQVVFEQSCDGSRVQLSKTQLGSGLFIVQVQTTSGSSLQHKVVMY